MKTVGHIEVGHVGGQCDTSPHARCRAGLNDGVVISPALKKQKSTVHRQSAGMTSK